MDPANHLNQDDNFDIVINVKLILIGNKSKILNTTKISIYQQLLNAY